MGFNDSLGVLRNSINANSDKLSTHSNNIALSSINGSRGQDITFATLLAKEMYSNGNSNPQSFTSGPYVAALQYNFNKQGEAVEGESLSLFLEESHTLFVLKSGQDGQYFYTKDGQFSTDSNGNLVTANGFHQVLGYLLDANGKRLDQLTTINLKKYKNLTWSADGTISGENEAGVNVPIAQIAVSGFANDFALSSIDGGVTFKETASSGPNLGITTLGGVYGNARPSYYESSNIDYMEEVIMGSMPTQRFLQANYSAMQALLSMTDKFLQTVVN